MGVAESNCGGLEAAAGLRANGTAGTEKPVIAKILDEMKEAVHWTLMAIIVGMRGMRGCGGGGGGRRFMGRT